MIVVIGATGFIGVYTVEKLIAQGYSVLATGRNPAIGELLKSMGADFIPLDITEQNDFAALPVENVEGVILLAGLLPANARVNIETDENAADYIRVNTLGTLNVLEYCRKNGIRKLISTTSYADVFNAWKRDVPLTEEEPRNFKYTGDHAAYVISKNAASDMIEYYNQQHGLQGATFRLPPVYGVGPHSEIYVNGRYYKTGIQTFIENARVGKEIQIWGDPHISRDIIYVKDVAAAYALALQSDKTYGLYNMTSGVPLTLEDQVRITIDVFQTNSRSKITYLPEKQNNTPSFLFDMAKAKRDFGFVPQYLSYRDMMLDYKAEMESGRWNGLIQSRLKEKGI